jgi:hypothetical protein
VRSAQRAHVQWLVARIEDENALHASATVAASCGAEAGRTACYAVLLHNKNP